MQNISTQLSDIYQKQCVGIMTSDFVLLISVIFDLCLSSNVINRGTQLRAGAAEMTGHYHLRSINNHGSDLFKTSNFIISVHAGEPTAISSHNLAYVSSSITNEDIIYVVTEQLQVGQGHLVLIHKPNELVERFTQADVDAHKLVYLPPRAEMVPKRQIFTMHLAIVRSPDNLVMVAHQPFTIRLQPSSEGEPQFRIINPIIQVEKMRTSGILKEYFDISGSDNDNPDLKYVIIEMPKYGALFLKCKNISLLNLDGGVEFSLLEDEDCVIQFEHYADVGITEDMFVVLATDGYFELVNSVYLEIISNQDDSSVFHDARDTVIQFVTDMHAITVNESTSSVQVPVQRWGDVTSESQVECYTAQHTAMAGKDYVGRPRKSFLVFPPGVTLVNCEVFIIDDTVYEKEEEFTLRLEKIREAVLGENIVVTLKITDLEDRPKVEFERLEVSVTGGTASTITVNVLRSGDLSQESRVRVSTCDESASAGVDYEPVSQLLVFSPGTRILPVQVKVIHRLTRTETQTFTLALSSKELTGAQLGEKSSLKIKVKQEINSQTMKILPTRPIIVSLLEYDIIPSQYSQPSPGYPLICVSGCDAKHPHFRNTRIICATGGINETLIDYSWNIAAPAGRKTSSPFRPTEISTIFGNANNKILDSLFFAKDFKVQCVTTPFIQTAEGLKIMGIPLRSQFVNIGEGHEALCPRIKSIANSFVAVLRYMNSSDFDEKHKNTIHVHLEIPHSDGMVPLVSTSPLTNPHVLLLDRRISTQHKCSNLHNNSAFLSSEISAPSIRDTGFNRPYQLSSEVRGNEAVQLYQHLNLHICTWKFDAWFQMSQLVDDCGGKITSEFQVGSQGENYVTVKVPLYVTYMSARASGSWTAVEYRTEMEVSFSYTPLLWNSGISLKTQHEADVQITKISADEDGRMVVNFETIPQFLGYFVMSHKLLPGVKSELVPPSGMFANFSLELIRSQATWDRPEQQWRATSDYSLMDYSGVYTLRLIPCAVQSLQQYYGMICSPQGVIQKELPISFRQSTRPIPLAYKLNTHFILTNDESSFLARPLSSQTLKDYTGVFLPGDVVYGKVFWHSSQHLHTAYSLTLQRLYLCAGMDDYIPSGPQYGCLQTSPKMKHSFLLLNRENPFSVDRYYNGIEFEVHLASDIPEYEQLYDYTGVDGFIFNVDPLYKINSGYKWYLQVLYSIGAAPSHRNKRSTSEIEKTESWLQNNVDIKRLRLRRAVSMETVQEFNDDGTLLLVTISLSTIVVVIVIIIGLWARKKWNKDKWDTSKYQNRRNQTPVSSSKFTKSYSIPTVTVWNNIRAAGTQV